MLQALDARAVSLKGGILSHRRALNRSYLMSLRNENLLDPYYMEAGLVQNWRRRDVHGGWESPEAFFHGHFLGHWLSAATRLIYMDDDLALKVKADQIVSELKRCQVENGGGWAGPFPTKRLDWTLRGKNVGVPHYVAHKGLMGLWDMVRYTDSAQALDVLTHWADWFYSWTNQFTLDEMDKILEVESGGMLEVFASLYGKTGDQKHRALVERYTRRPLLNSLLKGEDMLSNMHANTTVPEILGIAEAYRVTGEAVYKQAVEAYWKLAVTDRGQFVTGGQTSGEVWCPPGEQEPRLGSRTQEHCVVYNMIRLASILHSWTGDAVYQDYIERNVYNGILAQQHPDTGMPAYYLPLEPNAKVNWGTPEHDFWCCHGSVVQAHTVHEKYLYSRDGDTLYVNQYFPSTVDFEIGGMPVRVLQETDPCAQNTQQLIGHVSDARRHPEANTVILRVKGEQKAAFTLSFRVPWWIAGDAEVMVERKDVVTRNTFAPGQHSITVQTGDTLRLVFPKKLTCVPLTDNPGKVAVMDGPVVLAGLCDQAYTLIGDPAHPEKWLTRTDARQWMSWRDHYFTQGQPVNFRFVPVHEVRDSVYNVYFSIREL